MLTAEQRQRLLRLARHALESHFGLEQAAKPPGVGTPEGVGGVFATLKRDGELRGCIGYIVPDIDLPRSTELAVVSAAKNDPRFSPVTAEELAHIRIGLSLLQEAVPVDDVGDIEIGRDGLVVERDGVRGLLLPQVASERGWDRERFLAETCIKAGLEPESWRHPDTLVKRFAAVNFSEA